METETSQEGLVVTNEIIEDEEFISIDDEEIQEKIEQKQDQKILTEELTENTSREAEPNPNEHFSASQIQIPPSTVNLTSNETSLMIEPKKETEIINPPFKKIEFKPKMEKPSGPVPSRKQGLTRKIKLAQFAENPPENENHSQQLPMEENGKSTSSVPNIQSTKEGEEKPPVTSEIPLVTNPLNVLDPTWQEKLLIPEDIQPVFKSTTNSILDAVQKYRKMEGIYLVQKIAQLYDLRVSIEENFDLESESHKRKRATLD